MPLPPLLVPIGTHLRKHLRLLVLSIILVAGAFHLWRLSSAPEIIQTDVFVYGATLGGSTAALAAVENNVDVVLATDGFTLGGQAVDGGLSAFDEAGRLWEWSSFQSRLRAFVASRYDTGSGDYVGTGKAVVGLLSVLPRDIEDFFLSEASRHEDLHILRGYELVTLRRKGVRFTEALLRERADPRHRILVRFSAVLDGTQTGRLFAQAEGRYHAGFDVREETGEWNALPLAVRRVLMHGDPEDASGFSGVGNRVQPVGVPFMLVDRGYRGEFYPASVDRCWTKRSDGSTVATASLFTASREGCTARVAVVPDFSDVYDVYLINHGNRDVRLSAQLPSLPRPIALEDSLDAGKEYVLLGTWYFDHSQPAFLTFTSTREGYAMEGVVLARRNVLERPITIQLTGKDVREYRFSSDLYMTADLYLFPRESVEQNTVIVRTNGREKQADARGAEGYMVRGIAIERGLNSIAVSPAPAAAGGSWAIVIVPTHLSPGGATEFTPRKMPSLAPAQQVIPSASGKRVGVHTWEFSVAEDDTYVLGINWPSVGWGDVQIIDRETQQNILAMSFHNPYRGRSAFTPLLFLPLRGRHPYEMRMSSSYADAMANIGVQLYPLRRSDTLYAAGSGTVTVQPMRTGMVDIWVSSPGGNTSLRLQAGKRQITVSVGKGAMLSSVGRLFARKGEPIRILSQGPVNVLLVPNTEVDVLYRHVDARVATGSIALRQLPPGQYRLEAFWNVVPALMPSVAHYAAAGSGADIALTVDGMVTTGSGLLMSDGSPQTVRFLPSVPSSGGDLYLYEDVPSFRKSFFQFEFPLLAESRALHHLYEFVTFFNYRNVVSPSFLLSPRFVSAFLKDIARSTLGISIVLTGSNDYAPVYADMLDDRSVYAGARDLSYRYYYWLRYDSDLLGLLSTQRVGCNIANLPICDPRRLYLAPRAMGTPDGFSRAPYVREGRRMRALKPLTENDITLGYQQCVGKCDPAHCLREVNQGQHCLLKEQDPVLSPDAVAAAAYALDFHSFFSREEWNASKDLRTLVLQAEDHARALTGEPTLFHLFRRSTMAEITLGSLLPFDGGNLYPASTNFGVTQIANSAFRTHVNEMRVGTSAGYMVSYALRHGVTPRDLYDQPRLRHAFQLFLIGRGVVLYPINDAMYDDQIVRVVQTLILEGMLRPVVKLTIESDVNYGVEPKLLVTARDRPLLHLLSPSFTTATTYRQLITLFREDARDLSDEALLSAGKELGLVNDAGPNPTLRLLDKPLLRGAVYRAVYLRLVDKGEELNWQAEVATRSSSSVSSVISLFGAGARE